MRYEVKLKPQAVKDLQRIPHTDASLILSKTMRLQDGLGGDVKRLNNFFPKFRLRAGVYRVLFEVEAGTVFVYRILHRRMSYD